MKIFAFGETDERVLAETRAFVSSKIRAKSGSKKPSTARARSSPPFARSPPSSSIASKPQHEFVRSSFFLSFYNYFPSVRPSPRAPVVRPTRRLDPKVGAPAMACMHACMYA